MSWIPGRRGDDAEEWLDAGLATDAEIAECYREIDAVNRWLGGFRATFGPLAGVTSGAGVSVLDVAGGDGAFADRFAAELPHAGRIAVVDRNPVTLGLIRARGAAAIGGDARSLPFRDRTFDIVHAACFFHHLSTPDACDVLGEMCRVSRRLVIVNDLVRSVVAWAAIWALTRTVGRSRVVRHDAPLSVSKAFRPRELSAISRVVSSRPDGTDYRWRIDRIFPYRMTLVGIRTGIPA